MTTTTFTQRQHVIADLLAENYRAQREFPSVGSDEHPTPWDVRHDELNNLLTELETCD